ncbi:MAG: DUF924 family protein, partial [Steroidobacter sp.]
LPTHDSRVTTDSQEHRMHDLWIEDVIHFWFEELEERLWFTKDERVDLMIRERFERLHEHVRRIDMNELTTPRACVAAVIVLDQLPRNMYRNSPLAYETDAQALSISQYAIGLGFDQQASTQQRIFLYMPWQHSEDAQVQARSVELFTHLNDASALDYARQHREIIDRFGRFPHRNNVLGRTSSAAVLALLATHPGF